MKLKITDIKPNPDNPRTIKDANFKKLVQSLKDLPVMTELREVILDENHMIIGGNMRYRAAIEAGWSEIAVKVFTREDAERNNKITGRTTTYEEYVEEILIKDNVSGGDWDWDLLANEWNAQQLSDWGLNTPVTNENEEWADIDDFETSDNSLKLVIQFESEADRQAFEEEYGIQVRTKGKTTWSTWWPYKDRNDYSDAKIQ